MKRGMVLALICGSALLAIPSGAHAQTYLTKNGLTLNQDFITRVEMAMSEAAIYIRQQPTAGGANHQAWSAFAGQVLGSPRQYAANYVVHLMSDPVFVGTITCSGSPQVCTTTVTDAQLYAVVSAQWAAWAVQ